VPDVRAAITPESTLRLWVAAGGRCEYCNVYLLTDGFTGYPLNLAERAHIVGATDALGSPRGDSSLALELRAEPENLILLCRTHHRLIDRLIAEHTVEGLLRMKREHEERILLLTALTEEARTVVVRAIGGIRGAAVEIPRSTVLATVTADGRYPRYPLALAGEDIEIDLRNLPEEGVETYWAVGTRVIEQATQRIRNAQEPIPHLSVFALTRIPLLVALGFHLDDKVPTTIYQRRRDGAADGAWAPDKDATAVTFTAEQIAGQAHASRVAIAVSLTALIGAEIASSRTDPAVYEIAPSGVPCSRDILASRESLHHFADSYHQLLEMIEREHPDCVEIDLFPACPAAAAIELGRGIMRDAQPALAVYDRDPDGTFHLAVRLPG
jgi:hypothetical protein